MCPIGIWNVGIWNLMPISAADVPVDPYVD